MRAFIAMFVALLSALPGFAADRFVISATDKNPCQILLGDGAIPSERYAAEELQQYLQKITGVKCPIVENATKLVPGAIVLGDSPLLHKLAPDLKPDQLGPETFVLRTTKKHLIVAGGRPRGTLYGVYTLLEENLGVRWFTPELEVVQQTNKIVLGSLNRAFTPALEYRQVFWTEIMRNADFAARHRINGEQNGLSTKHGGPAVVYFPFVHSMDSLVPPELFKEHPEYFPLIGGKRADGYVQRCLSNPEVIRLSIAAVRKWIQEHPNANIISVSQNDTGKWCQCDQCKAFDDAEGSPAASLIRFVNTIAEDIEHDYPRLRIDTLAYQYTRKPPKTLRPRPNVIIRLCSIECCFAHPLATCESTENKHFREDIIAWQPVAPKLYVWDYTPNFGHYQQPFPNFDAIQPNVQFFVQHRVAGLFEQGNYSAGGNGELGPLRAYLLAKLLWDPNTDLQRHTTEFLNAYYRDAAPFLQQYLELMENQVRGSKAHTHIFDSSKARYLNDDFLAAAGKIFDTAEKTVTDETIRFRVQVARLPIDYVVIATNRVQGDERAALLKRFLEVARKAGVSNISESQSLDEWAKKQGAV